MKISGVFKRSGVANLTTNKKSAIAWARAIAGDDDLVVLTFVVPVEMLDYNLNVENVLGLTDIPMKFCKKVEKIRPVDEIIDPTDVIHDTRIKNLKPEDMSNPSNPQHEKQIQDKLSELRRNPSAYIPAWMKNDPRLKGYLR
jgi:hypothetical protein